MTASLQEIITALETASAEVDVALTAAEADLNALRGLDPASTTRLEQSCRECIEAYERLRSIARRLNPSEELSSRDGLAALLRDAQRRAHDSVGAARARLQEIAALLASATSAHPLPLIQKRNDERRRAATEELEVASESGSPPQLPGPSTAREFLRWVAALSDDELAREFAAVADALPKFVEFVADAHSWKLVLPPESEGPIEVPQAAEGPPLFVATTPPEPPAPPAAVVASPPPARVDASAVELSPAPSPAAAPKPRESQRLPLVLATSPALRLPTYRGFAETHWTGSSGRCEAAPWASAESFSASIESAFTKALDSRDLASAYIFARAAESIGRPFGTSSALLETAADLLAAPSSTAAGADPERAKRTLRVGDEAALRIYLALEALRPSGSGDLVGVNLQSLIENAGFQTGPLRRLLTELLELGFQSDDPVTELRRTLEARPEPTAEELAQRLKQSQLELKDVVFKQYSACGGRVERTHCREAWREWMDEAKPLLDALVVGQTNATAEPAQLTKLEEVRKRARKIFDKRSAERSDRTKMDRTVTELIDRAKAVCAAAKRLRDAQQQRKTKPLVFTQLTLDAAKVLMEEAPENGIGRGTEALATWMVLAALRASPVQEPLALRVGTIAGRPALLEVLPSIDPEIAYSTDLEAPAVPATRLKDYPRAAALLLQKPIAQAPGENASLLQRIDSALRSRRDLAALIGLTLPKEAAYYPARELESALQQLHARIGELRQVASDLDATASPDAVTVSGLCTEASREADGEAAIAHQLPLLLAWLESLTATAKGLLENQKAILIATASEQPEGAERVRLALAEGRLSTAALLAYAGDSSEPKKASERQTAYRGVAQSLFPEPRRHLTTRASASTANLELVEAWKKWVGGGPQHGANRSLRRRFVEFAFPDHVKFDLANEPGELRLSVAPLRKHLAGRGLNPSFLPQLSRFGEIVILTPPVEPSAPDFVRKTADVAAPRNAALLVVLAPGVAAEPRTVLLQELRNRDARAVVIDDLDLCRLLGADGAQPNGPIALLELFLEQQKVRDVSPFESGEGQHVLMEMFVGRNTEANLLATSVQYSRVFSGRKLGKSALLRFVEETRDGKALPSGNKLRVVYVPAVGIEDEHRMVTEIEKGLRERLQFSRPVDSRQLNAADRLEATIEAFLAKRPTESLLLVLDEADSFVESQVDAHRKASNKEACLSFFMRSRLESRRDTNNHPRVRFVFVGYRSTHTGEGAWANWGEVLRLQTLQQEDAARLIEGPLARLGIDAQSVAHGIAWRCGYQPAVLLAFGRQLLESLERKPEIQRRERATVSDADVSTTFTHPTVQAEIRQVVRNNFKGNREAGIVFSAVLRELAECAPAQALEDAPQRVVDRLRSIDPDLSWLRASDESILTEVARLLREFVDRQLLIDVGTQASPGYRLRFPHHLGALKPHEQEGQIKEDLAELRAADFSGSRLNGPSSLLRRSRVQAIQDALLAPAAEGIRVCVAASLWPDAVQHPGRGLPARIGMDDSAVAPADRALQLAGSKHLFVTDCPPDSAGLLRERRDAKLPPPILSGGLDLLRWARRRASSTEDLLEIATVARLTQASLAFWFERARGYEFEDPKTLLELFRLTSGIPPLVALVDREWVARHGTGVNLGPSASAEATQIVKSGIPELARSLMSGPPSRQLKPRELEVLRMVGVVAPSTGKALALKEALMPEGWSLFGTDRPESPLTEVDHEVAYVLQAVGLLPVDPEQPEAWPIQRIGNLAEADALLQIIAALPDVKPAAKA